MGGYWVGPFDNYCPFKHPTENEMPNKQNGKQKKKAKRAAAQRRLGALAFDLFGVKGGASWGGSKPIRRRNQTTTAPKAIATAVHSGRPVISSRSAHSVRIRHKELLGSVDATDDFTITGRYNINPGLSDTFPWLSREARGYERYKFHALRLCYRTRTSTDTSGSIMLACDYDGDAETPLSDQQMGSFQGSVEDSPWKDIIFTADTKALLGGYTDKYIRSFDESSAFNHRSTDGGILYVGASGGPSLPLAVGKLWVEYDVTLITPHVKPASAEVHDHQKMFTSATGAGSVVDWCGWKTTPVEEEGALNVNFYDPGPNETGLVVNSPGVYYAYFQSALWQDDTLQDYGPCIVTTSSTNVAWETIAESYGGVAGVGSTCIAGNLFGKITIQAAGGGLAFNFASNCILNSNAVGRNRVYICRAHEFSTKAQPPPSIYKPHSERSKYIEQVKQRLKNASEKEENTPPDDTVVVGTLPLLRKRNQV